MGLHDYQRFSVNNMSKGCKVLKKPQKKKKKKDSLHYHTFWLVQLFISPAMSFISSSLFLAGCWCLCDVFRYDTWKA
jgi:hypothetical protein